jgi:lysyl endopeptidase
MRPYLLLLACAAPLSCLGTAFGAAPQFRPDLATLSVVPRLELPAEAVRKALAEPVKHRPFQYAVPVEVQVGSAQGRWRDDGAQRSWRLRIHSPGALSLSVHFAQPTLPAGATLWIYDPAARLTHGPFDASRLDPTGLWTPPVAGEELVVEVRAPQGSDGQVALGKARAFHGFRDWNGAMPAKVAGSCNIDVSCPSAAAWSDDADSVARISIGGAFLCSGQLLNNARQDRRRLFLTANHCGVDEDSGPAASVIFYFGYEGPCDDITNPNPLPPPTFQGAQRLAHDVQSDFTLLLVTDPTPLPVGLYFAGWDATGASTGTGVAIHHPGGDEKKIAFFDSGVTPDTIDVGAACDIAAWRVQWASGTTEPGSSGGGLWDSSHRLIGLLSGGGASCMNPTDFDYFARLDRGWTAGAAADRQLKAHLDPDGTCVAIVPGLAGIGADPGPVAPTISNQACAGQASNCSRRGGGLGWITLAALALAALLSRLKALLQHHQHHAHDRHG